jgi:hypothetical protein
MGVRRWTVPLVSALAVLAVVAVVAMVAVRWGQSPDDGGGSGGSSGGSGSGGTGTASAGAGSIAVSSFYAYDERHLALNYTNGIPACYGDAGVPVVEETPESVVVTIPRRPVKSTRNRACVDLAVVGSVDITLGSPLAGRPVLDGTRAGAPVEEAAAPNDPDQAR